MNSNKLKTLKKRPQTIRSMLVATGLLLTLPLQATSEKPHIGTNYLEQLSVTQDVTMYTTGLMGDTIDVGSGSFSFSHTDLSIPGNFALPVAVTRKFMGTDSMPSSTREFGSWGFDLPHIRTNEIALEGDTPTNGKWFEGKACSGTIFDAGNITVDTPTGNDTVTAMPIDFWNGDSIHVPGQFSGKLLAKGSISDGDTYSSDTPQRTLNNHWKVTCIQPATGDESFQVTTDKGDIYTFEQIRRVPGKIIQLSPGTSSLIPCTDTNTCNSSNPGDNELNEPSDPGVTVSFRVFHTFMMATKVEDRFGNYVTYDYDNEGRLQSISSSDSRGITVTYNDEAGGNGLVKQVTDSANANRNYQYQYIAHENIKNFGDLHWLNKVVRPDQREWQFDMPTLDVNQVEVWNDVLLGRHPLSQDPNIAPTNCYAVLEGEYMTMHHPDGVSATFNYKETGQRRTEVPYRPLRQRVFMGGSAEVLSYQLKPCNLVYSLKSKVLTNTDDTTYSWNFEYEGADGFFKDDVQHSEDMHEPIAALLTGFRASDLKTTRVKLHDGSVVEHHFSALFGPQEGKELVTDFYDTNGTTLLRRVVNNFIQGSDSGATSWVQFDESNARVLLNDKTTIIENGNEYYQEKTFNSYDATASVAESNDFNGKSKTTNYDYQHDTAKNLLNLPTTVELVGHATPVSETTYKELTLGGGDTLVPSIEKRFGIWLKDYVEYHDDGNVTKIEFNQKLKNSSGSTAGNNNRYINFSNFYRGKARTITVPARYNNTGTQSANLTVNSAGSVTSVTDYNDNTTGYHYDVMERLISVETPGSWLDTYFEWDWDISADGPVRTEYRCTLNAGKDACSDIAEFSRRLQFDGYYRPILTTETDLKENTTRYQNRRYDSNNQMTFESYWSHTWSLESGTSYSYDGLERLKTTSVYGAGNSSVAYLAGNKQRVTNFRGKNTTTEFLAYGAPAYKQALEIVSPEGVTTTQAYNQFDNITSVTQTGPGASLTQTHSYDAVQNMCKTSRSDVGNTVYSYNEIGEVEWMVEGAGGSNTGCAATYTASDKVEYEYDNLGDMQQSIYDDSGSSITVTRTLDPQGNLTYLSNGAVAQYYTYNSLNLLKNERLNMSEKSIGIDYGYSPAAHLDSLTYPNGDVVSYAPNGFGQPTQAIASGPEDYTATYAAQAKYHSSGQLKTFNYGNGLIHNTTLNNRQIPEKVVDYSGAVTALNLTYSYDPQSNIKSIIDGERSEFSLNNLVYDDLDRLISTSGGSAIGNSSISYDGLGNITAYDTLGSSLVYHYDATNKLDSVTGTKPYEFLYDSRGNVRDNGARGFTFNRANQLTKSISNDVVTNSYIYDGHNRRVKSNDRKGESYFLYSQSGTLLYSEKNGRAVNHIFLGKKLIAKDGVMADSTESSLQHYKPFGETIETPKDDVGYTGHKFDTDLGLSYMQARYYDPVIGRFMSNDPVGFTGEVDTFNRYSYVANNPYKYVDPDGRKKRTPGGSGADFVHLAATIGEAMGIITPEQAETMRMIADAGQGEIASATKRRVKLRKKTREKIDENTPRDKNGNELDPHGNILDPEKIDIGHKPGQEWRKRKKMHEEKGSTRKEVIEAENDPNLYQKEDRSRNRSHQDEEKD